MSRNVKDLSENNEQFLCENRTGFLIGTNEDGSNETVNYGAHAPWRYQELSKRMDGRTCSDNPSFRLESIFLLSRPHADPTRLVSGVLVLRSNGFTAPEKIIIHRLEISVVKCSIFLPHEKGI